jgi:hypothetical protein
MCLAPYLSGNARLIFLKDKSPNDLLQNVTSIKQSIKINKADSLKSLLAHIHKLKAKSYHLVQKAEIANEHEVSDIFLM